MLRCCPKNVTLTISSIRASFRLCSQKIRVKSVTKLQLTEPKFRIVVEAAGGQNAGSSIRTFLSDFAFHHPTPAFIRFVFASMTVAPRQVAVAIPVRIQPPDTSDQAVTEDRIRIYLVSSRKHAGKFVLPKGGIESGETSRRAAVRELWEEAGLIGEPQPSSSSSISSATPEMLTEDDHKPHKKSPTSDHKEPGFVPRARYTGHEVLLQAEDGIKDDWPEAHERQRKAFTIHEAEKELEWRKDVHSIFKKWAAHIPSHS